VPTPIRRHAAARCDAFGVFELMVFLHIVTVVVGIGGVVLNGLYAKHAMKGEGTEGIAVSEANFAVSGVAEKFIYAIPVFGILAVLASDDAYEFSETWIWLSTVLYVVALGISHSIMIPGHRRLNVLGRQLASGQGGEAEMTEIGKIGKKLAPAGAALDILAIVIIALMVWKPGN
jgi:uncharacterized membrane protein